MIGVCLIGAGRAGMIHARNFAGRVPGAKMVAVADPMREAREAAMKELGIDRGYEGFLDALDDPLVDAVVIVSPTKYHREIAIAAAQRKKHILCEKPMAMDEAECEDMIRAASRYGVKLQIGFMRRYDESFVRAKEMIDAGEIGEVVLIKSHTRGPSVPQPWMYDIQKSNGPLAEVCSHDIDTARWFAGSELKSLYAIGGNYRSPDARVEYPDFYDNVVLTGVFENGVQCVIDGAQGVGYGYDAQTEVLGSKGMIRVGREADQFVTVATAEGGLKTPYIPSWRKLFRDAYLMEDIRFIECIERDEAPRVTGFDGKMAVKVVKAGNTSIVEKRIVAL